MAFAATLHRDLRTSERHSVDLDGTLRDQERRPYDVSVTDLSADGFRAEGPADLAPAGACIVIGLPGLGARGAIVMRVEEGCYGCRFQERLTTDEFNRTLAAVVTAPIPFPERARAALLLETALPPVVRLSRRLRVAAIAGAAAVGWAVLLGLRG